MPPVTSTHRTACPHDCPSVCALEVERRGTREIVKVRGARENSYTLGVTCAKVARYGERLNDPRRLRAPMRRRGAKGEGTFVPLSWDDALDEIAEAFIGAAQHYGSETVWPFHSGGTMGLIQRYGIERLRHAMRYSGQDTTICITIATAGWRAGVGAVTGPDPREIAESDLVVVWGTNPVATQVNVMSHIARARKERGARLVVVDTYQTPTAQQADVALILRPGTDGALAAAVMHVLLAEGLANRKYLAGMTDFDAEVERHLARCTPAWAASVTGLSEDEIITFARLYGNTQRSYIRVGLGFSRSRNGATAVHAVSCLPSLTGAWHHRGGGAFLMNLDIWGLDSNLIQGLDSRDPSIRILDQSRIGPILTNQAGALGEGPPVTAMLVQNANPAVTAPDSRAVARGLARDDLFLCVHEQFPTATTRMADIVLPATMFLECDDMYMGWGHTHLMMAPHVVEPLAEARSNHDLICGLARRLGAEHPGFDMTAWELMEATLVQSGLPDAATLAATGWHDCAQDEASSHFRGGFAHPDGRFRFKPDWSSLSQGVSTLPSLPGHVPLAEDATPACPFRLVAPPSRSFLNTSFSESHVGRAREGSPRLLIHPDDAAAQSIAESDMVLVGNHRGSVRVTAKIFSGLQRGVVVVEGLWPNDDYEDGMGINLLTGADPVPPSGGSAFHDTAVWVRPSEVITNKSPVGKIIGVWNGGADDDEENAPAAT